MKDNKGFTIVELIVSFSICIAVTVILFQVVIVLKEVYEKSEVKTALLNKQNIFTDLIYEDILDKKVSDYNCSNNNDNNCGILTIYFQDNSSKRLSYSTSDNAITYGDYTTSIIGGSIVSNIGVNVSGNTFTIDMPIKHKLFKDNEEFGINVVHYLINE